MSRGTWQRLPCAVRAEVVAAALRREQDLAEQLAAATARLAGVPEVRGG